MLDYTLSQLLGYYDRPDQPVDKPTYNPPLDAPCFYCVTPLTPDNVRTHSIMAAQNTKRSYFYRTHSTCDEAATAEMKDATAQKIINYIESL